MVLIMQMLTDVLSYKEKNSTNDFNGTIHMFKDNQVYVLSAYHLNYVFAVGLESDSCTESNVYCESKNLGYQMQKRILETFYWNPTIAGKEINTYTKIAC